MNDQTEIPWWRVTGCVAAITNIPSPSGGFAHYMELYDSIGQRARFVPRGFYFSGRDVRVQIAEPAQFIGTWEQVPGPGETPEFDADELGKLLGGEGDPIGDNSQGGTP